MFAPDRCILYAIKARTKIPPNSQDRFCCKNATSDQGRQRGEKFKSLKIGLFRPVLALFAGNMLD